MEERPTVIELSERGAIVYFDSLPENPGWVLRESWYDEDGAECHEDQPLDCTDPDAPAVAVLEARELLAR